MKKLLSVLLACVMILSLAPVNAFADAAEENASPVCASCGELEGHAEGCPEPALPEPSAQAGPAESAEPAAQAVPVTFVLLPQEAALSVFDPDGNEVLPEGGVYLLPPGEYSYNAALGGYVPVEGAAFTVSAEAFIAVELAPVPEPSAEGLDDAYYAAQLQSMDIAAADAQALASCLESISGAEIYEIALRTVLTGLYESYDGEKIGAFELAAGERAAAMAANYREAYAERQRDDLDYSTGSVLVLLAGGGMSREDMLTLSGYGFRFGDGLGADAEMSIMELPLPLEFTADRACGLLSTLPSVRYAQKDRIYSSDEAVGGYGALEAARPNDIHTDRQWYMDAVNIYEAWELMPASAEKVRVAVIDSNVDYTHPDLQAALNRELSWDFTGSTNKKLVDVPMSTVTSNHGTHVAGIIAATANNSVGVAGAATGPANGWVELIAISASHDGSFSTADLIQAIYYAADNGARVINLSLGGYGHDTMLEGVMEEVYGDGVLFVCAGGNGKKPDGSDTYIGVDDYHCPSDCEFAVAVIALEEYSDPASNPRTSFSDYGANKDIGAPGSYIYSTVNGGGYQYKSGTSMAAPVVSAAAALLFAADPTLTAEMVKEILYSTAEDLYTEGYDLQTAWGCVDAEAALQRIGNIGGACGAPGSDLRWNLSLAGVLTISGTGTMASYDYSGTRGSYLTNAPWREHAARIKTVVIQSGVTSIGSGAFEGCSNLAEAYISGTVESISPWAFTECSALERIEVSSESSFYTSRNGVLFSADMSALCAYPCAKGGAYAIPNGVESVFAAAFENCLALTAITIPASVTELEHAAEYFLEGSEYVVSRTNTPSGADKKSGSRPPFTSCAALSSISVSGYNSVYSSDGGALLTKDGARLIECPAAMAETYTMPGAVNSVGDFAFYGCSSLSTIVLPGAFADEAGYFTFYGCGAERLTPQDIPAPEAPVTAFTLDKEYLLLKAGADMALSAAVEPVEYAPRIVWESSDSAVLTVSESGVVTAMGAGTAYVWCSVSAAGATQKLRCRVDVTAGWLEDALAENGRARLTEKTAASAVYSTEYTEIGVFFELLQNSAGFTALEQGGEGAAFSTEGVEPPTLTAARFCDEAADAAFSLRVIDDSRLAVIPKADVSDAAAVRALKSSYRSAVEVTAQGVVYVTADTLTLRVDKKLPTAKASSVKLNSFYDGYTAPLTLTSTYGEILSAEVDWDKATARAPAIPDWLRFDAENMSVSLADGFNGRGSGRLWLKVYVKGYSVPASVGVSVSASYTKPSVRLSASSVTVYSDSSYSGGTELALKSTKSSVPFASLGVTGLWVVDPANLTGRDAATYAAGKNYTVCGFDSGSGTFTLETVGSAAAGRIMLEAEVAGTGETLRLSLTVRVHTRAPSIRLGKGSVTLNANIAGEYDGVDIPITSTPGDFLVTGDNLGWVVTDRYGAHVESSELDISYRDKVLTVRTTDYTGTGRNYRIALTLRYGSELYTRPVTLSVNTLSYSRSEVSLTLSAKGKIASADPESAVTLTPRWKNYLGGADLTPYIHIYSTARAYGSLPVEVTEYFDLERAGGAYLLRVKNLESMAALDPKAKYTAAAEGVYVGSQPIADGRAASITFSLAKAGVLQDVRAVTLYRFDRFSEGQVLLTLKDPALPAIEAVRVYETAARPSPFDVKALGGGVYAIGFKDDEMSAAVRAGSVRLEIFLAGNSPAYSSPNATVSVSVKLV